MHVPLDRFDEAYEHIKDDAAIAGQGAETVLIFVAATDIDAICACKLLVGLLKTDWIAHKIVPVCTFTDLGDAGREIVAANEELRSIILLNCGGLVPLAELFPDLQDHQRLYVFESQRPLHLSNLFGNQLVYVFDDGHIESELVEERAAFEATEFDNDANDDQSEEDPDAMSTDDDEQSRPHEDEGENDVDVDDMDPTDIHGNELGLSNQENENVAANDSQNADPPPAQKLPPDAITPGNLRRKRKREARRERERKRRNYQSLLIDYYTQGTWYGTASSVGMFTLANQLGRLTLDYAWYGIVGLTYQYLNELIAEQRYMDALRDLDAHVARLSASGSGDGTSSVSFTATTITRETEYRLEMLRHWTLMDSLQHSRYVAAKVSAWTERGISRLRFLLTKVGVPIEEYAKPFVHMRNDIKVSLFDELIAQGELLGLDKLKWISFVRSTQLGQCVAASDAVSALGALTVYPHAIQSFAPSGFGVEGDFTLPATASLPESSTADPAQATHDAFFAAFDALSDDRHLIASIHIAKPIKRALMSVAGAVITRKAIKTLKGFRYVLVRDTLGADACLVASPGFARQLALMLFAALREINRADLPLVVGVLQPAGDMYLMTGFTGAVTHGLVRRNLWALAFQAAAEEASARHVQDMFDAAVIEVAKDDVTEFIEQLQVHMGMVR